MSSDPVQPIATLRKFIRKTITSIILNTSLFWCWDCDKIRLKGNQSKTHCKNCFNNKCHVCEIDCQDWWEHEICPCSHQSCYDESMAYEEETKL